MIKGVPVFDGISLLQINLVDWSSGAPSLSGVITYINTSNGKTYGSGTYRIGWTQQTYDLLEALRRSMEEDIGRMVFNEGMQAETSTRSPQLGDREPSGIGEDIGDAQQV